MTSRRRFRSLRRNFLREPLRNEIALAVLAFGVCDCGADFIPVAPSYDDAASVAPEDASSGAPEAGSPDGYGVPTQDAGIADVTVDDAESVADAAIDGDASDSLLDAGTDTAAEGAAPACDATKSPKDDSCVINDAYGVFVVSAIGVDGGPLAGSASIGDGDADASSLVGTMNNPVVGIGQGIALAIAEGKSRVYVCNAYYAESVVIASPVSLFGGLSCVASSNGWQWAWVGGSAQVAAPAATTIGTTVFGLEVSGLGTTPISVEDIAFSSPNGFRNDPHTGVGASSIAAFVTGSTVSFVRVSLSSGKGGSARQLGAQGVFPSPAPSGQSDRTPGTTTCAYSEDGITFDSSTGGTGGSLAANGGVNAGGGADPGTAGTAFPEPVYVNTGDQPPADGAGGAYLDDGDNGENGAPRSGGTASPTAGHLSASGWTPATGGAGLAGQPGQGGGGSGSIVGGHAGNYDGAGGGSGGCGGLGGFGGAGGGASVALVSFASTVSLSACTLVTASGGTGYPGEDGQGGQAGGSGGLNSLGLTGGNGGDGAGGSGGAGGPAGISVGILYAEGALPFFSTSDTTIIPGGAGAPGSGGKAGAGPGDPGNPGANGTVDPHASSPYWLAP